MKHFVQVLATSTRRVVERNKNHIETDGTDGDTSLDFGHDDETMVSSSRGLPVHGNAHEASNVLFNRDKHLRYRTRVFAAEYVMLLACIFLKPKSESFACLHVFACNTCRLICST